MRGHYDVMPEKVRLVNDPVLRKPCQPIPLNLVSIQGLLDLMYETMTAENGIGLAANQIGHSDMVFILKDGDSYKEYVNPEILSQEELVDFENEGCLSIPGVVAKTKRYRKVKLQYSTKDGVVVQKDFEDIGAFAVQHEIDHLNGKLYIDQFGPVKKDMTLRKHKKFLREIGR